MLKFENRFSYLREFGFSVFQLLEREKDPCGPWKKYQTEKVSLDLSKEWDKTKSNIGIATGKLSGIFVFDVDGDVGRETFHELTKKHGKLPDTLRVKTNRGHHYYFSYPDDREVRNLSSLTARGEVAKKVDIRGEGGYVVAPPSIHPDGGNYSFENELKRSNILPAPEWFLEIFAKPIVSEDKQNFDVSNNDRSALLNKEIEAQCMIIENTPEGNRNNQLNKSAFALGQYIHLGLPEEHIEKSLTKSALLAGLEEREIRATIASGLKDGQLKPKSISNNWQNPDMSILIKPKVSLPECPHHLLGDQLKKYIDEASQCKSAPPDYIFASLLNAAAGVIGNSRKIEVWEGWQEATALWFMLVGLPSCNKSPALDAVFPIIREFEAKYQRKYQLEKKEYEVACELFKSSKKQKNVSEEDFYSSLEEPAKPIMKRIIVNDTTVEKLALLLSENVKGLIYHRDELAGLLANLEKNGGSDRPVYLESFGGRPMSIDRIKYDDPIYVPSVLLSIIGSIQPDKLDQLLLKQPDDGFSSRFIYVSGVPKFIKEPNIKPDYDMLKRIIEALESLDVPIDEDGIPKPKIIPLCEDGRKLMQDFCNRLQSLEEKEHGMVVSHIGKLRGIAARVALVLQYIEWAIIGGDEPNKIDLKHIENAIYIAENYFFPMAKHCLRNVSVPQDEQDGRLVAKWLIENGMLKINAREVLREIIPNRDTKRRDSALSYLEECGWLKRIESQGKSVNYDVNARVFEV